MSNDIFFFFLFLSIKWREYYPWILTVHTRTDLESFMQWKKIDTESFMQWKTDTYSVDADQEEKGNTEEHHFDT